MIGDQLLLLALATATIANTVTKASVFRPIRMYARRHFPWLGKLVTCSYCTSHWAAFFLVAFAQARLVVAPTPVAYVATAFAVVAIATPIGWGMRKFVTFTPDPDLEEA